jgi:hypothetical protein
MSYLELLKAKTKYYDEYSDIVYFAPFQLR